mmetsp:Transcript_502/g.443  ORF Transcript_502/g.443 Transcript_502/m.443 type:complete len:124 (-) Transcript_502:41-412(-)
MMTRGIRRISIKGFILKKKHLQSLISHTRNLEIFELEKCKIETLSLKFHNIKYKVTEIDFRNCGNLEYSDWVNNPAGFFSILNAIEECGLKDSVKFISIRNFDFRDEEIIDRYMDMGIRLRSY